MVVSESASPKRTPTFDANASVVENGNIDVSALIHWSREHSSEIRVPLVDLGQNSAVPSGSGERGLAYVPPGILDQLPDPASRVPSRLDSNSTSNFTRSADRGFANFTGTNGNHGLLSGSSGYHSGASVPPHPPNLSSLIAGGGSRGVADQSLQCIASGGSRSVSRDMQRQLSADMEQHVSDQSMSFDPLVASTPSIRHDTLAKAFEPSSF